MTIEHKAGNMLGGLLNIVDGFCSVVSLGNWNPSLHLKYTCYRARTGFLSEPREKHRYKYNKKRI